MRAVAVHAPGSPDTLEVIDRDVREPGPGEVRIDVRAAAVNPTDLALTAGLYGPIPSPCTPGMDAAGTIESVGDGVDRLAIGDQVMAVVLPGRPEGGAQAERIVVPAASVVAIPDGATLEQAATLPMNGLTARLGLDMLGLSAGSTLAVTGGAGLVASYVIPLAKQLGLRVIADAKPEDEELVRSFGADVVVPRGDGFVAAVREAVPDGVDGLYDTAVLREAVLGAVRDGGSQVDVRVWDPESTEREIEIKQVFVDTAIDRTDWLEELRQLASDGRIQLRVAREFGPEQAAEAYNLMGAGGLRGRALIVF